MTAEVEEELRFPAAARDLLAARLTAADHLVDAVRQPLELADELGDPLARERPAELGQPQCRAGT